MRFEVKSKTWLEVNGHFVMGEGGIALLEAIDRLGSIQRAAREIGWSYRHAWGYLKNMEHNIGIRIVRPRQGGRFGGGTRLTPEGAALLRDYKRLQRQVRETVKRKSRMFFSY